MSPCHPLSLRHPLILNLLWQQRQLWEFRVREERGPRKTQMEGVVRSWTWLTLLASKGFHLPRSWMPCLGVISTTSDLHTRHVPIEAPKSYPLQHPFFDSEKNSHILWKSLMRFGHVRTVQNTSTLHINVNSGSTIFVTPNSMEAEQVWV